MPKRPGLQCYDIWKNPRGTAVCSSNQERAANWICHSLQRASYSYEVRIRRAKYEITRGLTNATVRSDQIRVGL
ncbi:hypothetical protein BD289DRAFT_81365 [Coniella lustricola]|uniref:Uncharacterized protein n=1 Tax=Coniella lustricola TaxID=2025994 RepID=A0A2T3AH75_9PEZI|nr:hypothetical protein BD289DRAFT_81365 [Coniella lustricola]